VAPPLFDVECASGLVKAVRRRRLDAARALDDLLDLLDLSVERLQSPAAVFNGLGLALEYGISAYDAVYVALAHEEGLPLVTADARLVRALAGSPHTVLHLDDVEL
jgi:predicted nucleic acid-binding protein